MIKSVKKRLKREKLDIEFNRHTFGLFIKYYDLKSNEAFCYIFKSGEKTNVYKYSQQVVDLIVDEIKRDPKNIIDNLKKANKKDNPRGKGILNA